MVILDTNIIIDHLRQQSADQTALIRIAGLVSISELALSVISIQELFEGQSSRDREKRAALLSTIAPLTILPYTGAVAQRAGEIARDSKQPLEFADAAIAATTIMHHAQLCTFNEKHFRGIPNLSFFKFR